MYPNLTELLEEDPREKKLAQWIQSRFAELRRAVAELDERVEIVGRVGEDEIVDAQRLVVFLAVGQRVGERAQC